MKVGVRKPSLKRSIKARTTGRVKRAAKRTVNPLYGKKGMGLINDPKKAVYNKVYNKTTIGVRDIIEGSSNSSSNTKYNEAIKINSIRDTYKISEDGNYVIMGKNKLKIKSLSFYTITSYVIGGLCLLVGIPLFFSGGFILTILGIGMLSAANTYKNIQKDINKKD